MTDDQPARETTRRDLLRKGAILAGTGAVGAGAASGQALAGCDAVRCPKTPGYWKNHFENWNLSSLDLGYATVSASTALEILNESTQGDKCVTMERHLIAALLNVEEGTGGTDTFDVSCITGTIADAQTWLATYCDGTEVTGSWPGDGEAIKNELEDFNEGRLCPANC